MTDTTEIRKRLVAIVADQMYVDRDTLTDETHFFDDLDADSLDAVELVMEAEDEFEISISDDEAETLTMFGAALAFVVGRIERDQ